MSEGFTSTGTAAPGVRESTILVDPPLFITMYSDCLIYMPRGREERNRETPHKSTEIQRERKKETPIDRAKKIENQKYGQEQRDRHSDG